MNTIAIRPSDPKERVEHHFYWKTKRSRIKGL